MEDFMDFKTVAPYLPAPIVSLKAMWDGSGKQNTILFDTALAAVGFVAAAKFADRVGVASVVLASAALQRAGSNAPVLAVLGYNIAVGANGAFSAAKANDVAGFAINAARAVFAYALTTGQGQVLAGEAYNMSAFKI
jgi:putative aminopeptidase FrvX